MAGFKQVTTSSQLFSSIHGIIKYESTKSRLNSRNVANFNKMEGERKAS